MAGTILATFDRVDDAHAAIDTLRDAGFKQDDIGLAINDVNEKYVGYVDTLEKDRDAGEGAELGTTSGAVTGGVIASLVDSGIPVKQIT